MIGKKGRSREERFTVKLTWFQKITVNLIAGIRDLWKKNSFPFDNLQRSLKQEKSNFQNRLITATEEKREDFGFNIENNNFSNFLLKESTWKDMISKQTNTG